MTTYSMICLNRRLVLSITRAHQDAHDDLSSTLLTTSDLFTALSS